MTAYPFSMDVTYPLRMDNSSLLSWTTYFVHEHYRTNPNRLYDLIVEEAPDYKRVAEDPTLLGTLHALLLAHLDVERATKDYRYTFVDHFTLKRFAPWVRRDRKKKLDEFKAKRKKAHDTFEMYRRLCFNTGEGLVFKFEFT